MTGLIDNGGDALELGQCPHRPGTPEWVQWQQHYLTAQRCTPARLRTAIDAAKERAATAGIRLDEYGHMTYINDPPPLNAAARAAVEAIAEANEYDRAQRTSTMPPTGSLAGAIGMTVIPGGYVIASGDVTYTYHVSAVAPTGISPPDRRCFT